MTDRQRYAWQLGRHLVVTALGIAVSVLAAGAAYCCLQAADGFRALSEAAERRARRHQADFWGMPEPRREPLRRVK